MPQIRRCKMKMTHKIDMIYCTQWCLGFTAFLIKLIFRCWAKTFKIASIKYWLQVGNKLETQYIFRLISTQNRNEISRSLPKKFNVQIELNFLKTFYFINLSCYAQLLKCIWHNSLPTIENWIPRRQHELHCQNIQQ